MSNSVKWIRKNPFVAQSLAINDGFGGVFWMGLETHWYAWWSVDVQNNVCVYVYVCNVCICVVLPEHQENWPVLNIAWNWDWGWW